MTIYLLCQALEFTQPLTEISTRNRKKCLGSKARPVRKADLAPSRNRLSKQYRIFHITQPYRTPRPATGIALVYGDGVYFL
jgi:hypothetical protein